MRKERADNLKQRVATITLTVLAAILVDPNATASSATRKPRQSAQAGRKAHAVELGGIGQLKGVFQSDAGKVRLVTLVSPT